MASVSLEEYEALQAENERLRQRLADAEQQAIEQRMRLEEATQRAQAGAGGTLQTIAPRLSAQDAAELRMAKFAMDRAADAIYWFTVDGQVFYANDAACSSLGYSRDELLKKNAADIDPSFPAEGARHALQVIKQQGAMHMEATNYRKDGSTFLSDVTITALEFDGEEYLCAFARDITERKQTEEELRAFKALVETAPDGIATSDMQGILTYANAAYRAMYGYGDAIIGMSIPSLVAPHEQDRLWEIIAALEEHGSWQGLLDYQRQDSSIFPAQISALVIYDDDQRPQNMAVIVRDISEQQRAEQERIELQNQVIEAQRAAIRELSTPLMPLSDQVMVLPLVGAIDSRRAQQIMETLLEGVAAQQARTVIVDITGVQVVDSQVANILIQAAHAVKLIGAQVVLTGIQPRIAQTLVELGADLSTIVTRSTLQAGIAYAAAAREDGRSKHECS
jgi:rsbT co-antagonist protein RsbR